MDKKVIEMIQTAIEADSQNQEDFQAYDDMDNIVYDFGDKLEKWMIPSVSTEPHTALKVLDNIFDSHNPRVNILPFGEADKDRAEKMERWLDWQFSKISQRTGKSPIRQMSHMAGKYGRIALQVDYLPYWLPRDKKSWTNEQKQQMRSGPFCIDLHNPKNVYYGMGKYGLRWVASVSNMTATEIVDHWGVYEDKKMQAALKKIQDMEAEDEEVRFIHVDFTSHDKRYISVFQTKMEGIEDFENFDGDTQSIDLLNTDNKLKFLNWVVVECDSTPLLAGMHKGNLYAFQTIFDTVKKSGVMRRAYPVLYKSKTVDKKGINIEMNGVESEARLGHGDEFEVMQPPPMDSAVFTLANELDGQVDNTLGVSKLGNMQAGGNLQYSTVNAIIDLNMNKLEPYKRMSEKALEQASYLMLKWVEYTQDTVTSYRTKIKKPEQIIGEEILLSPDEMDADTMVITVTLTTKADKMAEVNRISMLKQANFRIPDSELLEGIGYENSDVMASMYEDEQLRVAALKNHIMELEAQIQLKVKAAEMQMQMQMQQAQMQQQQQQQAQRQAAQASAQNGAQANPQQGLPSEVGGQGFNPAMGGDSSMVAQPGMTASQVPGQRQQ